MSVYVNHLEGDMQRGRRAEPLPGHAAAGRGRPTGALHLDRGGDCLGLLLIGAVFVHNRWAALLAVPAIAYPLIFIADLWLILYQYGHSIDPEVGAGRRHQAIHAAHSGRGHDRPIRHVRPFEIGFYLVVAAVVVVLMGLWFHRAAYKPVVDARKRAHAPATQKAAA